MLDFSRWGALPGTRRSRDEARGSIAHARGRGVADRRSAARDVCPRAATRRTGAAVANVVHIPGKALLCGLGVVVGGGLLILTLGAAYKGAAAFGKEGCGGKWVLTPSDLRGTDFLLGSAERSERD